MHKLQRPNFNIYEATLRWGNQTREDIKDLITDLNLFFREILHDTFWQSRTWGKVSSDQWKIYLDHLEKQHNDKRYSTLDMIYTYLFGKSITVLLANYSQGEKPEEEKPLTPSERSRQFKEKVNARITLLRFLVYGKNFTIEECQEMKLEDFHQFVTDGKGLTETRTLGLMEGDYLFYDIKKETKNKYLSISTLTKILKDDLR